jgi:hypothetical protein
MAKYLILIYGDEQSWATASEQERRRLVDGHVAFKAAAGTAVLGGEELEPGAMATSLRSGASGASGASGRAAVTDGPFLESKEGIGGYYLLEVADLDEAIALARLLPEVTADHSGVEIRPVVQSS